MHSKAGRNSWVTAPPRALQTPVAESPIVELRNPVALHTASVPVQKRFAAALAIALAAAAAELAESRVAGFDEIVLLTKEKFGLSSD